MGPNNSDGRANSNGHNPNQPIYINKARKKFEYTHQIQCSICHQYGYDLSVGICRVGAQCYHATNFFTKEPEKAKANTEAYALYQAENNVKAVQARQVSDEIVEQIAKNISEHQGSKELWRTWGSIHEQAEVIDNHDDMSFTNIEKSYHLFDFSLTICEAT